MFSFLFYMLVLRVSKRSIDIIEVSMVFIIKNRLLVALFEPRIFQNLRNGDTSCRVGVQNFGNQLLSSSGKPRGTGKLSFRDLFIKGDDVFILER